MSAPMANEDVWMACEKHLGKFGAVLNCAPCLQVTLDYVRAALREARTDKKYWERVANCLLSTCTDAQSDAAIGAAIEQGAIDAAMKPPGEQNG